MILEHETSGHFVVVVVVVVVWLCYWCCYFHTVVKCVGLATKEKWNKYPSCVLLQVCFQSLGSVYKKVTLLLQNCIVNLF